MLLKWNVHISNTSIINCRYEKALRDREIDKEKLADLLKTLGNAEADVNSIRRRVEATEDEVNQLKKDSERLDTDLQKARTVWA